MGYFREIVAYQNPLVKETQISSLIQNLISNGWSVQGRWEDDSITYTLNSGDWITVDENAIEKVIEDLSKVPYENSFCGIQLKHKGINRIAWLYQRDGNYRFELNIATAEFDKEPELFKQYYAEIENSINKLKHILHLEWRSHYDNQVIRSETNIYHEGVLILASSKKLIEYYSSREFDGAFPEGIQDLITSNSIIAINCWDYCFETIIEIDKITDANYGLSSFIEFEEDDKLLFMHHGDFTMTCSNHKGDYEKHGWKSIIPIEVKQPGLQEIKISRSGGDYDGQLLFQFRNRSKTEGSNKLIDIKEIPTHNTV